MKKNEQPIIVGLDIGTTKIVAIAGRKNANDKIEILGLGKVESMGVHHGTVLNIEHCTRAIDMAIEDCIQSNPDLDIKEVYVGISGQHIRNTQTNGTRIRSKTDDEISKGDIELLICEQYKTNISFDDQIIDVIPQSYMVDDIPEIISPIGMRGIKIDCNFNLVTCKSNIMHNIDRCMTKAYLKTKKIVLQSIASASAIANEDDMEAGVMVLDIGGGTTDMVVYKKGILKFNAVIPLGGINITNAISEGLNILRAQAEVLKIQYGTAAPLDENELQNVTIQNLKGLPPKEISLKTLSEVIQTNVKEILDYAMYYLKQNNLEKHLYGGIILTGGSAQIKGIAQFTEQATGMGVRIGYPDEHLADGRPEALVNPQYATGIGLILQGNEHYEKNFEMTPTEFKSITNFIDEPELRVIVTEPLPPAPSPEIAVIVEQRSPDKKGIVNKLKYKFMGIFEKVDDQVLA